MKKKIRHIVVANRKYNWRVTSIDSHYVLLRVWVDGFKKLPWFEAKFPFKDPWLNLADLVVEHGGYYDASEDNLFEGITPKKVSIIIETVLKDKGLPPKIESILNFTWCPKTLKANYNGV